MKSQRIASEGAVDTLVVILDNGEEAFSTLQNYARQEEISAASLTAIGAFASATVGWFDFARKSYKEIEIGEQCEVLSAIGDVAVAAEARAGPGPDCMAAGGEHAGSWPTMPEFLKVHPEARF